MLSTLNFSFDHTHHLTSGMRHPKYFWELSGITKSLPFAQKVNQPGHVHNPSASQGRSPGEEVPTDDDYRIHKTPSQRTISR